MQLNSFFEWAGKLRYFFVFFIGFLLLLNFVALLGISLMIPLHVREHQYICREKCIDAIFDLCPESRIGTTKERFLKCQDNKLYCIQQINTTLPFEIPNYTTNVIRTY